MFNNIPKILPNELFFSWLIRIYEYHPLIQRHFIKEMLGANSVAPYQIKPLAQKYSGLILIDEIINKHSVARLFKAFLYEDKYQQFNESIKASADDWKKYIPCYDEYINERIKFLHICPLCCAEDISEFGFPYLHVEHQLRDLKCCYKHKVNLLEIKSERIGSGFYPFYNLEDNVKEEEVTECIEPMQLFLAQCTHEVVNKGYLQEYDLEVVQRKYRARIRELGYWRNSGIDHPALQMAICNYYGEENLNEIGIKTDLEQRKGWTYVLTTRGETASRISWHFLLIGFLFDSIKDFMDYEIDDVGPFGVGPWVCLNKWCKNYKKPCIEHIQYKIGRSAGTCIGVFECEHCHYKYKRKGNYNDKVQADKIYIEQYGDIWDEKLKQICEDKDICIQDIKNLMGCSRGVVQTQMRRLGIDPEQYPKKSWRTRPVERIKQCKEDLLKYLNENKSASREDVRKELSKQWDCLEKYEKEWLYANIPERSAKWQGGKANQEQFWLDKDKEMLEQVKQYIDIHIGENDVITKKKIAEEIGYYALNDSRYKDKLPKTYSLMEQNIRDV